MRLRASRGVGVQARTWLSLPGTRQTRSHSGWAVRPGPGTDLDQSERRQSKDSVGPAGAHPPGRALWQIPDRGQRLWDKGGWGHVVTLCPLCLSSDLSPLLLADIREIVLCKCASWLYFESCTRTQTTGCHTGCFPQSFTQQQGRGLAGHEEGGCRVGASPE